MELRWIRQHLKSDYLKGGKADFSGQSWISAAETRPCWTKQHQNSTQLAQLVLNSLMSYSQWPWPLSSDHQNLITFPLQVFLRDPVLDRWAAWKQKKRKTTRDDTDADSEPPGGSTTWQTSHLISLISACEWALMSQGVNKQQDCCCVTAHSAAAAAEVHPAPETQFPQTLSRALVQFTRSPFNFALLQPSSDDSS